MGRPSTVKPARTGASRRDFFKHSGSAAVALAAVPSLGWSGGAADAASNPVFQHGVASGDPLSDRVILWTRASSVSSRSATVVNYVVATDPALSVVVASSSTKTNVLRDFTVKVDVPGLRPNTTYYYRFAADGAQSPVGRTKTLPDGAAPQLRMAVVSCSNFAYGYFNVYQRIAERADLDLVVHLGDYLYEYGTGQYGTARACGQANEIVSSADYRARHAQYKRHENSQAMHRQHPMVAIWDDHETTNNAWVGGAENHQPATEGDWVARVAAALQANCEWMPVRVVDPTAPRRNDRSYAFGNLVDLIMLEERVGARSEQLGTNIGSASGYFTQTGAYADPTRRLLGATEKAWLFDKLRTSTAKWKMLGQGVLFAQLKAVDAPNTAGGGVFLNSDQWDGYQPARNRIYDVLKGGAGQAPVGNVVALTGDIHSSWAADLTPDPNNPSTAAGGYDPSSGEGSLEVEFVGTSVSSPGVADPHIKYINPNQRGYMLIDADASRCVCEWWYIDTVASISNIETFAVAFEVRDGSNRLAPSVQTPSRLNPPALAP